MPELPEVETVVRMLRARLVGRRVLALRVLHPDVFSCSPRLRVDELTGARFTALNRRGKLLLFEFERELVLSAHLRMTGHFWIARRAAARPAHTHFELELDRAQALRFCDPRRFGRLRLLRRHELGSESFLRRLGPEPSELSGAGLAQALARRRGALKAALLDQTLVAGLGNIYADEILFRCGLHPELICARLRPAEVERLRSAIAEVIAAAVACGGSTIRDYRNPEQGFGGFQIRHAVFDREGEPCPSCGTEVRKIRVGGRGTHFCPRCQPRGRRAVRRAATN
jgi:formamidopyrimidine-DNA glycosylase